MAKKTTNSKCAAKKTAAKKNETPLPHLAILDDPWLNPVQQDVIERHERFVNKLQELESYYPTLVDFAGQYKYLGLNYDSDKK